MSIPTAHADPDTYDLLDLIADEGTLPVHRDDVAAFLAACQADAAAHDGLVSVQRVRTILADAQIPPRRLSSLWAHHTGDGRPMRRTGEWDVCTDTASRNAGRPR